MTEVTQEIISCFPEDSKRSKQTTHMVTVGGASDMHYTTGKELGLSYESLQNNYETGSV